MFPSDTTTTVQFVLPKCPTCKNEFPCITDSNSLMEHVIKCGCKFINDNGPFACSICHTSGFSGFAAAFQHLHVCCREYCDRHFRLLSSRTPTTSISQASELFQPTLRPYVMLDHDPIKPDTGEKSRRAAITAKFLAQTSYFDSNDPASSTMIMVCSWDFLYSRAFLKKVPKKKKPCWSWFRLRSGPACH